MWYDMFRYYSIIDGIDWDMAQVELLNSTPTNQIFRIGEFVIKQFHKSAIHT
jgi:hypothetical protein